MYLYPPLSTSQKRQNKAQLGVNYIVLKFNTHLVSFVALGRLNSNLRRTLITCVIIVIPLHFFTYAQATRKAQ